MAGGGNGVQHTTTAGIIQYPRGQMVLKDAAARLEHLEGALGLEAGSMSLTSAPASAAGRGMPGSGSSPSPARGC